MPTSADRGFKKKARRSGPSPVEFGDRRLRAGGRVVTAAGGGEDAQDDRDDRDKWDDKAAPQILSVLQLRTLAHGKRLTGGLRRHRRGSQAERNAGGDDVQKPHAQDRKSTRLNSSHSQISYAVFCLK